MPEGSLRLSDGVQAVLRGREWTSLGVGCGGHEGILMESGIEKILGQISRH